MNPLINVPPTSGSPWSFEEISWLRDNYPRLGLAESSRILGRQSGGVRGKASQLKLTLDRSSEFWKDFQRRAARSHIGMKHPAHSETIRALHLAGRLVISAEQRAKIAKSLSETWKRQGHPRGALGITLSEEARRKISATSKAAWKNPNYYGNSEEYRQKVSDRMTIQRANTQQTNPYSRARRGIRSDIGTMFFRSRWEANYARYLNWMKERGEIESWTYEPDTFWFLKIKRGVRSYTPDFRVFDKSGNWYVEVKGWMDSKSQTKLKRMAKYHPGVRVDLLDQRQYKSLEKSLGSLIKGWEFA